MPIIENSEILTILFQIIVLATMGLYCVHIIIVGAYESIADMIGAVLIAVTCPFWFPFLLKLFTSIFS